MAKNEQLIKVFEYALNQEETGKSFFQQSLQRMGIGAAVTAFERLIQEEEKHIVFIKSLMDKLKQEETIQLADLKGMILEPINYFDERAKSEFLEQCVEGSMGPDVAGFNTAWLIEKDLREFYANMAQQAKGEVKESLIMLSGWEKKHEQFFREYRDKLSEVYSTMPWGG